LQTFHLFFLSDETKKLPHGWYFSAVHPSSGAS